MNGGKLIQNVTNHALYGTHEIIDTATQDVYQITSTHHQMQYPYSIPKTQRNILMYSSHRSTCFEGLTLTNARFKTLSAYEPEVVLYHVKNKPVCLAIQGHPEIMRKESPIISHLNNIINNL